MFISGKGNVSNNKKQKRRGVQKYALGGRAAHKKCPPRTYWDGYECKQIISYCEEGEVEDDHSLGYQNGTACHDNTDCPSYSYECENPDGDGDYHLCDGNWPCVNGCCRCPDEWDC